MKTIFFITAVFVLSWNVGPLSADETASAAQAAFASEEGGVLPDVAQDELVNFNQETIQSRFRELEQRMNSLERENRFQDDRIRNLERSLDDLKRRRLQG